VELRQLRYFLAVAEEGSFTRGAQRLRVAQPAVSQQIRGLERELGEALFSRTSRSVTLTAAGETLLPHARATLASAGRAKDAVRALGKLLAGKLSIGLVQAQPDEVIATLIGNFHQRYPDVRLAVLEEEPAALLDAVSSGRLDAAFVGLVRRPPAGIEAEPVSAEPLVVAVAPGHRLAGREALSFAELAGVDLASLVPGTGLRTVLDQQCDRAGFAPRFVAETTDLALLADLVARGVGAALIPASVPAGRHDVVTIPLAPRLDRRIALIWRGSAPISPAARAFLALARASRQGIDPGSRGAGAAPHATRGTE